MLKMIAENKQKNIAYAFLDEGSYGNKGLDELQSQVNGNCKIYYLDSVGAAAPLHLVGESPNLRMTNENIDYQSTEQKISYIFSARRDQENSAFYLDPADLKQKQLNMENITTVTSLFQ